MFNAEITWAGFTYREPTTQAASGTAAQHNIKVFGKVFSRHRVRSSNVAVTLDNSEKKGFEVYWCEASNREILELLGSVAWDKGGSSIDAELAYLRRSPQPVDTWLVAAPQLGSDESGGRISFGAHKFSCILRTRFDTRFNVFTVPEHVAFARWLVGEEKDVRCSDMKPRKRTGVLLVYPTKIKLARNKAKSGPPAMGFAMVLPETGEHQRIAFRVRSNSNPGAVVVERRK
jgi:hypothetical protein